MIASDCQLSKEKKKIARFNFLCPCFVILQRETGVANPSRGKEFRFLSTLRSVYPGEGRLRRVVEEAC